MSAIPGLKKKLKSVKATGKLSAALKTVAAAKLSKLSAVYKNYSEYSAQFMSLYEKLGDSTDSDTLAETVVVFGSNRGFCGGFNNEIRNYYLNNIANESTPLNLITCGDEITKKLKAGNVVVDYSFSFNDIPKVSETEELFDLLSKLAEGKKNYAVKVVFPQYKNTMTQIPTDKTILINPEVTKSFEDDTLWIPDKNTALDILCKKGFHTVIFGTALETALGAQAATLMTMRQAYDTANKYCTALESEIHRIRQSEVTADVIETASERGGKGDEVDART